MKMTEKSVAEKICNELAATLSAIIEEGPMKAIPACVGEIELALREGNESKLAFYHGLWQKRRGELEGLENAKTWIGRICKTELAKTE